MKTCQKKRVGFMIQGAPARHGAKIYSNGEEVERTFARRRII